jgi:hypothetical protein
MRCGHRTASGRAMQVPRRCISAGRPTAPSRAKLDRIPPSSGHSRTPPTGCRLQAMVAGPGRRSTTTSVQQGFAAPTLHPTWRPSPLRLAFALWSHVVQHGTALRTEHAPKKQQQHRWLYHHGTLVGNLTATCQPSGAAQNAATLAPIGASRHTQCGCSRCHE